MDDDNAATAANAEARPASGGAKADAATEARARRMGWIPESEWDGDRMQRKPKEFLSAEDYVEKVENDLPILRERNRFLDETVSKLEQKLDTTTTELKTNNQRVTELGKLIEDLHDQNQQVGKRAYDAAKRDLEGVKRRAVSEADEATYDEADRRLAELERHRPKEPATKAREDDDTPKRQDREPEKKPAAEPQISDTARRWIESNGDIMNDRIMNPVAVSIHTSNMAGGMSEAESLRHLTDQVKKEFPHKFTNGRREEPSTVATTSPPGRQSKKQTFDSLPADAKQTYERLNRYFESKGKKYTPEAFAKSYYLELEERR